MERTEDHKKIDHTNLWLPKIKLTEKLTTFHLGVYKKYLLPDHYLDKKYLLKSNFNLIKKNYDDELIFVKEIIAAKFYQTLSTYTRIPETKLISVIDKNNKEATYLASEWIEGFKGYKHDLPSYNNINSEHHQIKGVIENLVIAKFLGDFDAVGFGENLGAIAQGNAGSNNARVDFGQSLSFFFDPEEISLGVLNHFIRKIAKLTDSRDIVFKTFLPLEFNDPNNLEKINPKIPTIKSFIEYYYPDYNTKDLLLKQYTYNEIKGSFHLYLELCEIVQKITTLDETNFTELISYFVQLENIFDQDDLENLFTELKKRQELFKNLYQEEIIFWQEYQKNPNLDFVQLKKTAASLKIICPKPSSTNDEFFWYIDDFFCSRINDLVNKFDDETLKELQRNKRAFLNEFTLYKSFVERHNPALIGILIENENLAAVEILFNNFPKLKEYQNHIYVKKDITTYLESSPKFQEQQPKQVDITSWLLRTKNNQSPDIFNFLISKGANPLKQVFIQNGQENIFDISKQLPFMAEEKNLALITKQQFIINDLQPIEPRIFQENQFPIYKGLEIKSNLLVLAIINYQPNVNNNYFLNNKGYLSSIFLLYKITTSPNSHYFLKEIVGVKSQLLDDISCNDPFWIASFGLTTALIVTSFAKFNKNAVVFLLEQTSGFAAKTMLKNQLVTLGLGDNEILNNFNILLFDMQNQNMNNQHHSDSFLGYYLPKVTAMSIGALYAYKICNLEFNNNDIVTTLEVINSVFKAIEHTSYIHYATETLATFFESNNLSGDDSNLDA